MAHVPLERRPARRRVLEGLRDHEQPPVGVESGPDELQPPRLPQEVTQTVSCLDRQLAAVTAELVSTSSEFRVASLSCRMVLGPLMVV